MKVISRVLDDVHTLARNVERATRRKKRIRREHLIGAFHLARVLAGAAATMTPKAVPVAVILNTLNDQVGQKELARAPDSESDQ
jgi:hypothetical protein